MLVELKDVQASRRRLRGVDLQAQEDLTWVGPAPVDQAEVGPTEEKRPLVTQEAVEVEAGQAEVD